MRPEIISILRCPQTGEELRLFLIKDYKNGKIIGKALIKIA